MGKSVIMFGQRLPFFQILALLLSALMAGCNQAGAETAADGTAPMPEVSVMLAKPVSREVVNTYPGRLAPFRQAEVRARVAGILMKRLYAEGQEITEGETLFNIDDAQLKLDVLTAKAELARAEAELFKAQDTLRRHKILVEKKVMQEHDFVATVTSEMQARAAVDKAAADLNRADLLLSYAQVSAPISGRAGLALVSEGALVGEGEPTQLTTIEQINPIYVDFAQPSSDLLAIDQGLNNGQLRKIDDSNIEVRLLFQDGSVYHQVGRLVFSDTSINPRTENVSMRAVFPNPEKTLRPGTYLKVSLSRAVNDQVFLVPRDSLLRQDESSHVLVVSEQNVVEKRQVEAKELEDKNWLVTAGLKSGEKVIINTGQAAGLEGQKVSVAVIDEPPKLALRKE